MTGPSGAVWPYRLVTAVLAKLLETYPGRFTIETHTPVTSVSASKSTSYSYEVHTDRGVIQAKQVVYCTNAHTGHVLPLMKGKIFPARGHMTVQLPGQSFTRVGSHRSWNIVHGKHGLEYITQNGHTGEIFLGGGFIRGQNGGIYEMGNSADDKFDPLINIHLSGALPIAFGVENWGIDSAEGPRIKSMWTGIMGFTADGLPLVGRLPSSATGREEGNEWIAAGFNGYGMVNCWLSGKALALKILGQDTRSWFPEVYEISHKRLEAMSPAGFASHIFGA